MFNVGSLELVIVAVIGLLILGPERMPSLVTQAGRWIGMARKTFNQFSTEIERELANEELRQKLDPKDALGDAKKQIFSDTDDIQQSISKMFNTNQKNTGSDSGGSIKSIANNKRPSTSPEDQSTHSR